MEAVEVVLALLVGTELATEVVGGLVLGILEVVLAVGARLPDVEDGAGDGLAGDDVADHTVHLGDAAVGGNAVLEDLAPELAERSIGRPEGAENGGGCGVQLALGDDLMGDLIDEAMRCCISGYSQNSILEALKLTTRGREHHRCGGSRYGSCWSCGRSRRGR